MNVHLSQDVSNFVKVWFQSIKLKLLYVVCTVDMFVIYYLCMLSCINMYNCVCIYAHGPQWPFALIKYQCQYHTFLYLIWTCITHKQKYYIYTYSDTLTLCHTYHKNWTITKICLYNFDPLKPHFYKVKLRFTVVYIIFLIFVQNIDCGYSLEPPRQGGSNEYPQSMFWAEIWKILEFFYLKSLGFWR